MELKEFAKILDGCEVITTANEQLAEDNNFVIVIGHSDDIMSFSGAISDEGNCCDGGVVKFTKECVLNNIEEIEEAIETLEENGFRKVRFHAEMDINEIESLWCPDSINDESGRHIDGISWAYKAKIKHEKFFMMENGKIYCQGIVFKLSDLS